MFCSHLIASVQQFQHELKPNKPVFVRVWQGRTQTQKWAGGWYLLTKSQHKKGEVGTQSKQLGSLVESTQLENRLVLVETVPDSTATGQELKEAEAWHLEQSQKHQRWHPGQESQQPGGTQGAGKGRNQHYTHKHTNTQQDKTTRETRTRAAKTGKTKTRGKNPITKYKKEKRNKICKRNRSSKDDLN